MGPVYSSDVSEPTVTWIPGYCLYELHSQRQQIQGLPPMSRTSCYFFFLDLFMCGSRKYYHKCSFLKLFMLVNLLPCSKWVLVFFQMFRRHNATWCTLRLNKKQCLWQLDGYILKLHHKGHQSFSILLVQTNFVTEPKAKLSSCYPWRSTPPASTPVVALLYSAHLLPARTFTQETQRKQDEKGFVPPCSLPPRCHHLDRRPSSDGCSAGPPGCSDQPRSYMVDILSCMGLHTNDTSINACHPPHCPPKFQTKV